MLTFGARRGRGRHVHNHVTGKRNHGNVLIRLGFMGTSDTCSGRHRQHCAAVEQVLPFWARCAQVTAFPQGDKRAEVALLGLKESTMAEQTGDIGAVSCRN